jgi:hypothetical protein
VEFDCGSRARATSNWLAGRVVAALAACTGSPLRVDVAYSKHGVGPHCVPGPALTGRPSPAIWSTYGLPALILYGN